MVPLDPATLGMAAGGMPPGLPNLSSSSSATSGDSTSGSVNQQFGGLTVGTPPWVWAVVVALAVVAFLAFLLINK